MVVAIRTLAIAMALLVTSGGVAAGSVSRTEHSIQACNWGTEKHSTIHARPDPYSSWINTVYFKLGDCYGTYYIYVRKIDTRFYTSADPPDPIKRRISYLELKRPNYNQAWIEQPNKYCYNACVIQATFYPLKTVVHASSWWVKVVCEACWPATAGDGYQLFHYFVKGTYLVENLHF